MIQPKKQKRINRDVTRLNKIESISGKFEDGSEFRLFRDKETGQIELLVEAEQLRYQDTDHELCPVVPIRSFNYPSN